MTHTISNMDDTLDSRDIIERIDALTEDAEAWAEEHPEADFYTSEDGRELRALQKLAEQCEDYVPDWTYGEQLIRDSYFEQAMDELVEDIGDMPKDLPSFMTITLDYAALQSDYTSVDFDGVTYWVR